MISRQCRVNMCDVEGMALMLSTVTKTFGELKGLSAAIFTPSHHQGLFKLLLHVFFFHYEIKKPLKIRYEIFSQIFSPEEKRIYLEDIFVSLKRYIQLKLFFVNFGISCSFGSWISRHAERFEESDGGRNGSCCQ